MPVEFETNPNKDIRTNVIGLDGIMKLGIWQDFGDVCDVDVLDDKN